MVATVALLHSSTSEVRLGPRLINVTNSDSESLRSLALLVDYGSQPARKSTRVHLRGELGNW